MSAMQMKIDGLPVVDAAKSVVLRITKADVAKGKKKSPGKCAAALAAIREFHAKEARVHLGRVYVKTNGKWLRYLTPHSLRSEMVAFDRGGTFSPGDYNLLKMQPSRQYDSSRDRPGYKKRKKGGRGKKRAPYHYIVGVRPVKHKEY